MQTVPVDAAKNPLENREIDWSKVAPVTETREFWNSQVLKPFFLATSDPIQELLDVTLSGLTRTRSCWDYDDL